MLPRFVFIIMNNAVIRSSLRNYVEQCFDGLVFFFGWKYEFMSWWPSHWQCVARENPQSQPTLGQLLFRHTFIQLYTEWVFFGQRQFKMTASNRSPWFMLPSLSRTVTFRYLSNGAGWWKLADAINPCRSIRAGWSMVILRCLLVSQLEFFSPNFFSIRK